jgi:DNA-binding NtrC family response regulator
VADVLIVDDQPCVRELISEELICVGHQVTGVGSAESLMVHLRSKHFDLVLLDLYLDGPTGFELLGDIKREYPDLPVIIVTAYDNFADDPRLSGASGYVLKSTDLRELKQKVANVIRKRAASQVKMEHWPHLRQVRLRRALQPQ